MRPSYKTWRDEVSAILDGVEKATNDFKNQTTSIASSTASVFSECSGIAGVTVELLGPPHGAFISYNLCRSIARELTYRGFDYELALTDTTVSKLMGLSRQSSTIKSAMASPDIVDVQISLFLDDSMPCGQGGSDVFPWGYDRIGLKIRALTTSSNAFNLLVNFGVSVTGSILSLERVRDPKFCLNDSVDPVLKADIEDRVKTFVDSSAFAKSQPIPLGQDPFSGGAVTMYMAKVSPFLSLFSKRLSGRHNRMTPLQSIPSGWEAAIGVHPNVIKDRIRVELANASKNLVIGFRPRFDLNLKGDISLNPGQNSIDFDAAYYVEQQGGGGRYNPEWTATGWGVYSMRAVLAAVGKTLQVSVTKLAVKEYHASLFVKSPINKSVDIDSIPIARDKIKENADQPINANSTIDLGDPILTSKVIVASDRLFLYVTFRNT